MVSADAGATVGSVLAAITAAHDAELGRVLVRCSYLLDAVAVHGPETPVRDESVLDVLPPFAGRLKPGRRFGVKRPTTGSVGRLRIDRRV